jgi:hypothetical protein
MSASDVGQGFAASAAGEGRAVALDATDFAEIGGEFAFVLVAFGFGATAFNWHSLLLSGSFYRNSGCAVGALCSHN